MPEYIERKAVLKTTDILDDYLNDFERLYFVKAIKNIPTADVVEVVRCKDCLYKNEWANDGTYPDYNFCKHSGLWHLTDNHFCSFGVRKEGAEE